MKRLLLALVLACALPLTAQGQITVDIDSTIADKNCGDFRSILEAQGTYLAMQVLVQDSTADPFGLDADGDGIACAGKDIVRRVAPVDTTGYWYETVEKVDEAKCPALSEPMNVESVLQDIRALPTEAVEDSTAYATLRSQVGCLRNLGLLLEGLPIPEPPSPPEDTTIGGIGPSFNYSKDCEVNVDNATVHGPDEAGLTLPNGEPLAVGDTVSVVSPRDDCAGHTTVQQNGFTVAAAMVPDSTDFGYQPGLWDGEYFKLEVYDTSDSTAYRAWPVFRPCSEVSIPVCQEGGFENDSFYEVQSLSVKSPI